MGMRSSRLLSYLCLSGGACLLFLGAREFVESRLWQVEAEKNFTSSVTPAAAPPESVPVSTALPPPLVRPKRGEAIAKLMFPRLDKQFIVVEGDGKKELRRGPGHLAGSSMPGEKGNCV